MNQISINAQLILELGEKPAHGRALARRIAASQPTIARKLKELTQQEILNEERQGKNKVYSLTTTYQARHALAAAEHEKTRHFLTTHPKEAAIFNTILKRTTATIIILFGSYAKGKERMNSDFNLYMNIKKDERDALHLLHSKLRIQAGAFDVSTTVAQEIIRNHIILKGVDAFLTLTRPESKWQALG